MPHIACHSLQKDWTQSEGGKLKLFLATHCSLGQKNEVLPFASATTPVTGCTLYVRKVHKLLKEGPLPHCKNTCWDNYSKHLLLQNFATGVLENYTFELPRCSLN